MITKPDLDAAIAECVGERDPNANTCTKLAAYLTIRNELYPDERDAPDIGYSYAAAPSLEAGTVHIDSNSEFAQAVEGLPPDDIWGIVDELVQTVEVLQPRVYKAVLRKIDELR